MSKIGFTTSRSPTNKTRSLIHDLIKVVPNSIRFPRGTTTIPYCINSMKNKGVDTCVIINSVKGNPNFLRIYDLSKEPIEIPFAIKIRGLTLEREYRKQSSKNRALYSILISSLNNQEIEAVIKRVFGISTVPISEIKDKSYVTLYADYLEKGEDLIFIEFLDKENKQLGPRIKLRVIPRKVQNPIEDEK